MPLDNAAPESVIPPGLQFLHSLGQEVVLLLLVVVLLLLVDELHTTETIKLFDVAPRAISGPPLLCYVVFVANLLHNTTVIWYN